MFTIVALFYRSIGVELSNIYILFFVYTDVIMLAICFLIKWFIEDRRKK